MTKTRRGAERSRFRPSGRSDIREVFVRTYRIVYRVREEGILVLTVFEGHRLFPRSEDDDE